MRTRTVVGISLCAVIASAGAVPREAWAQEAEPAEHKGPRFRFGVEVKLDQRHSSFQQFRLSDNAPPSFYEPGDDALYMRTPAAGNSFEVQDVELNADAEWTPALRSHVVVHILDLYNRNPTSSAERISVREAWLLAGTRYEVLKPQDGTSVFLLLGKAPRFTKQLDRHLESYGLWGTAIGRFEQLQAQLGGSFGRYVYWRLHAANPNPLFMRDPNALAGDFGTPDEVPGHVNPVYQTGFPILYDTMGQDVNLSGHVELGGGAGLRFADAEGQKAIDVLGWYFERKLEDKARIHGTYYEGDLEMLRGAGGPSLAYSGRKREEHGVNLQARAAGLRVFGQYLWQDLAGLKRHGYEAELAYHIPIGGLFASGDSPVLNWIQPAVRYSVLNNDFSGPSDFVAPSFFWDWTKLDAGVRLGIVAHVDLTLEYERSQMTLSSGSTITLGEFLATARFAF